MRMGDAPAGASCVLQSGRSASSSDSLSVSCSVVGLGLSGSVNGVVAVVIQCCSSFPTSVLCFARKLKPCLGAVKRVQS
jgi:hypothetical protein